MSKSPLLILSRRLANGTVETLTLSPGNASSNVPCKYSANFLAESVSEANKVNSNFSLPNSFLAFYHDALDLSASVIFRLPESFAKSPPVLGFTIPVGTNPLISLEPSPKIVSTICFESMA